MIIVSGGKPLFPDQRQNEHRDEQQHNGGSRGQIPNPRRHKAGNDGNFRYDNGKNDRGFEAPGDQQAAGGRNSQQGGN
ncbi:hypothetical protein D3C73_1436030 [compost metagenome]